MRKSVLWRKQSHIIMMLAEILQIDAERALDLFYSPKLIAICLTLSMVFI